MDVIVIQLACLLMQQWWCSEAAQIQLGPSFVIDPPSSVEYPASAGTKVACIARGDPTPRVTWLGDDGSPLADIAGVRQVHSNGTLEIYGQSTMTFRSGMQPGIYRCKATNSHGAVLSRDVMLQPVFEEPWEPSISGQHALEGGSALLLCSDPVQGPKLDVAVWYRDDSVINTAPPTAGGRFVAVDKYLIIHDVTIEDSVDYSCLARHTITEVRRRSQPFRLTVLPPPTGGSLPRLITMSSDVTIDLAKEYFSVCLAAGHPTPVYTWYRENGGRLTPADGSGSRVWSRGEVLGVRTSGSWVCTAHNHLGEQRQQLRVRVFKQLTIQVLPAVQVADTGSTVQFNCSVQGGDDTEPAVTRWLHDGIPVGGVSRQLTLRGVGRANKGMYQCVARHGNDMVQAAAELRLGDTAPELHYTFIEQALRPGGSVSLRCAGSGTPPPRFIWLLDSQPMDQYLASHRYSLSEETQPSGEIVTNLNITSVQASDGGRYTCKAQNVKGQAQHSARLNIYGPLSIRSSGPVRVVAGANTTVYCPYSGYPISSIAWSRRDRLLGREGRVSATGEVLRLSPALTADAGLYSCTVTSSDGTQMKRDLDVQVKNPPKVSPFMFSPDLMEGSSVQVLCGVSSGDKPLYFSWLKDGGPIPPALQIQEKNLDEFSLLIFSDMTSAHSGDYTCRVSNQAAIVNYTANLLVKVPATWSIEPTDVSILLGAPVAVQCAARGYPQPEVVWYKRIGIGEEDFELISSRVEWHESMSDIGSDANEVSSASSWLRTSSATRAHAGVYTCKASNRLPTAHTLTKDINVTVNEPAHFPAEDLLNRNVTARRGGPATLVCEARGDVPIRIHWTRHHSTLDVRSYRVSISEVRTSTGIKSVLSLRSAGREDAGAYRCYAENAFGRADTTYYLHVDEPPDSPSRLNVVHSDSRSVRISWRAGHSGGASQLHYTANIIHEHGDWLRANVVNVTAEPDDAISNNIENTLEILEGSSWSTKVDGLRPASSYRIRLIAQNHVGSSSPSDVVSFVTLPEAPSSPPDDIQVRNGASGELTVSWSAPSSDTWNGELLGYVVTWEEIANDLEPSHQLKSGRQGVSGWRSGRLTLFNLRPFRTHKISVKAYNALGTGPPSQPILAATPESVPEAPPSEIQCEATTSRSVRVSWEAPPSTHRGGLLRGYDLLYAPLERINSLMIPGPYQTIRVTGTDNVIQGLKPSSNHSVTIRARTASGYGPCSEIIFCLTLDDVPEPPTEVQVAPITAESVKVWWSKVPNSPVTYYTVHIRDTSGTRQWTQRIVTDMNAEYQDAEIHGLRERQLYEFWVTAANSNGVSDPSSRVTNSPSSRVAPHVIGPSNRVTTIRAIASQSVRLPCKVLGQSHPRPRWKPNPHPQFINDEGDLIFHSVTKSQAGNYTCTVRNVFGEDSVTFMLKVITPPEPVQPRILRATHSSLSIEWDSPPPAGSELFGYSLTVSPTTEKEQTETLTQNWRSLSGPETRTANPRGLLCGRLHRIILRAYNAAGQSPELPPLLARTQGDKPMPSLAKELIWANSTSARINLITWRDGGCGIVAWACGVRRIGADSHWREVAVRNGESADLVGLDPETWYELSVKATSSAGETIQIYTFATLTEHGKAAPARAEYPAMADSPESAGSLDDDNGTLAAILLGAGAGLLLLLVPGVILILRTRSTQTPARLPAVIPTSQLYSASPSKMNGKADLNDISPYATFSMSSVSCGAACPLHLRDAAPPRRNEELYGRRSSRPSRPESDSESSGSPCAHCADKLLYRLPLNADTETAAAICGHNGGNNPGVISNPSAMRNVPEGNSGRSSAAPRRHHSRRPSSGTPRYFTNSTMLVRE